MFEASYFEAVIFKSQLFRYCFTELSRKLGNLTVDEHAVLDGFWEALNATNRDVVDLDLIVYLRTSPEVAFQRMQRRGRQEESTVPFSYLQALHTCYEEWLIEKKFGAGILVHYVG